MSNNQSAAASIPRHERYGLTADDLKRMYYTMMLARVLDERTWIMNRQGKIAFTVSGQGQEAAQVGGVWPLRPGHDFLLPYYRDTAAVLAIGMTAKEIMLGEMAKPADPASGGRQMPSHWGHKALKIVSQSSPVATQIPQATGVALASKIRAEDAVTWVSFGEGVTSKGDFHEGLNFAGIHKLPVIFFCENNLYAISVPMNKQSAVKDVAVRAQAYGMPGVVVDGNDALEVYHVTNQAVERARRGEGPTLIEAKTYRLLPHTSNDDDRKYRTAEEVEMWKQRDPLTVMKQYLMEEGLWSETADQELWEKARAESDEAVAFAESAPDALPEDLFAHLFAEEGEA